MQIEFFYTIISITVRLIDLNISKNYKNKYYNRSRNKLACCKQVRDDKFLSYHLKHDSCERSPISKIPLDAESNPA